MLLNLEMPGAEEWLEADFCSKSARHIALQSDWLERARLRLELLNLAPGAASAAMRLLTDSHGHSGDQCVARYSPGDALCATLADGC